jgi:Tol biopolymer transport system component
MKSRQRVMTVLLACSVLVYGQGGVSAEVELRSAMEMETVKGDLRGAIQRYTKLADSRDRSVAAKALLRMAQCHEKLGDAEARRIYERLVREFGDQTDAVAQARTKLGTTNRAKADRVVWSGKNVEHVAGNISPDGRWVSYTDWWNSGNLMVHDLVSGTDRSLTPEDHWNKNGNAEGGAFSPDSRRIAYGWLAYNPRHIEIRTLNPGDSGVPKPVTVLSDASIAHLDVRDWSSDGTMLAVTYVRRDLVARMGVVVLQDGKLRELKQIRWRKPTRVAFSPDGRYLAYDQPVSETAAQRDLHVVDVSGGNESTVASHAANDVLLGWSADGGSLLFRSNRGGAEGIYSVAMRNGAAAGEAELLKPDVGPVLALGTTAGGSLCIYRDTSTTAMYSAPVDLASGRLTGPPAVESYRGGGGDWSRDGRLLAFQVSADGLNYLVVKNMGTGQVKKLPTQMNYFTELRFAPDGKWLVGGAREFTGKAGLYRFDVETGATTLLEDSSHTNRVQVSPDGAKLYYEAINPRRSVEHDLTTGQKRDIVTQRTGMTTGSKELSPDGRYLAGIMNDGSRTAATSAIVVIPVTGGDLRELLAVQRPEGFESRPAWTPDSKAVVVVKQTGDRKEFWLIPVEGGAPRKLDLAIPNYIGGLRIHPNGRQIAFQAGEQSQEIWALENLTAGVAGRR